MSPLRQYQKDAAHFMRMYGTAKFDAFLPGSNQIIDFKTARDDVYVFAWKGYDPRNYHGRFVHPKPMLMGRQTHFVIYDEWHNFLTRNDPYNHTGANA